MGPASVVEAVWEVPVMWDNLTRWLKSRLACGDPGGVEFQLEADLHSKSACWL
jgi:hypothetical protein